MTVEFFTSFLAWCTLINLAVFLIWWAFIAAGGSWMQRTQAKWFRVREESVPAVHYKVMAYFKLLWVFFNLTPYLVLRLFV